MADALQRGGWDAIIADYSMPQFSGLSALQMLKTAGMDIPFILVSGSIGEDIAVAAMKAGAHDYLTKDSLARLVPAVQRELREAETRHAHRRAEAELRNAHAELEARVEERTRELTNANEALASEIELRKRTEFELRQATAAAEAAREVAAGANIAK